VLYEPRTRSRAVLEWNSKHSLVFCIILCLGRVTEYGRWTAWVDGLLWCPIISWCLLWANIIDSYCLYSIWVVC
jgi:hypothetical protein